MPVSRGLLREPVQLLDPAEDVGLFMPEVVQVGVERRAEERQLVVFKLDRVVQNGPLGS